MRDILFRGKRLDNGEWVEAKSLVVTSGDKPDEKAYFLASKNKMNLYHDGVDNDQLGNIYEIDNPTFNCIFYRIDPNTLGQYIGDEDKNGKKIFEGDVVRYGCGYDVIVSYRDGGFIPFKFHYPNRVEVVGNIHDNPKTWEVIK